MGTLHHLPETLAGHPDHQVGWRGELPDNVTPIRRPRYPTPLSAEGYAVLALIKALETRAGLKQIREDTFQAAIGMFRDWGEDQAVRAKFGHTMDLLGARTTGRW